MHEAMALLMGQVHIGFAIIKVEWQNRKRKQAAKETFLEFSLVEVEQDIAKQVRCL